MPYKKAKYMHKRQQSPNRFVAGKFRTVPISHATTPTGKKYKRRYPVGTEAVVGQLKLMYRKRYQRKYQTQSILIPRKVK